MGFEKTNKTVGAAPTELISRCISRFSLQDMPNEDLFVLREMVYLCIRELAKQNANDLLADRAWCYTDDESSSTYARVLEIASNWANDLHDVFVNALRTSGVTTFGELGTGTQKQPIFLRSCTSG